MPRIERQGPKGKGRQDGRPSAVDRLRSAREILSEDDSLKVCLYGRSGTGKTTFWSTFPKPIMAVIVSGGASCSGELKSISEEDRDEIDAVTIDHSSEIRELLAEFRRMGKHQTFALDHGSGLQDRVLAEILDIEELPEQKGWGLASREQYGQCTFQCKEIFKAILSLDGNVVIVAQERDFKGEDGDIIDPWVGAALTPSLAGWLHPACDYVVQTFIRNKVEVRERTVGTGKQAKVVKTATRTGKPEFCLRTQADAVYTTKFRKPKGRPLPEVVIDPDYDKIMAIINGTYEE